MRRWVLLDTGPLVAFLNRRDQYHEWAKAQLDQIEPPLLTCEAVLSEACFLVSNLKGGSQAVIELVSRELMAVPFRLDAEAVPVAKLLAKYASIPMSLADACLVRMAEQYASRVVLTLDSDFKLYRKGGRQVIPTAMPESL